jgi:aminobenzoyl-glutamate utilization protein B
MAIRATVLASKTLAYTAIDLFLDPVLITKAKEEFKSSLGDYHYKALLGDRKPALNYRD